MNTYKDFIVWQKSIELVIEIYKLTRKFPKEEVYGLVSQMRRAAVSIPSNIAEGKLRNHNKELRQFLTVAYSSGAELETQIEISKRLFNGVGYSSVEDLLLEVMKMLNKMISNLAPSA